MWPPSLNTIAKNVLDVNKLFVTFDEHFVELATLFQAFLAVKQFLCLPKPLGRKGHKNPPLKLSDFKFFVSQTEKILIKN